MKSTGLQREVSQIGTIQDLTGIFESIASMRIGRIKTKVTTSQIFFEELWTIYKQLRVDPTSSMTGNSGPKRVKPNVFLVLTGQGGLSGDIDERIIERVMKDYNAATTDLLVVGAHGTTLLNQHQVEVKQTFRLPDTDDGVDVGPIVGELSGYANPSVYYQKYVSLSVQQPDRINLLNRIKSLGGDSDDSELITTRDYLFEPSTEEVVEYLESVMLEIALGQVILESRLAQYASRFSAMSAAHKKAQELQVDTSLRFHRAKRLESDERLKEVIIAMKLK
jgi:F-type H+-transporting ATPase subunit gamma